MLQLKDFATLTDAQNYEHKTYRKIGGNEASQILFVNGSLDAIENAQTDTTAIEVLAGVPTTVGAACRTIVRTIENGQFATDPSEEDGQFNRAATQALVDAGIILQAQADGFYAKAEVTTKPYQNKNEYDFQEAKGTLAQAPVTLSVGGDFAVISTTTGVERHSPKLLNDKGEEVARFYNVEAAGLYCAAIPANKRGGSFTCEDAYGAIA